MTKIILAHELLEQGLSQVRVAKRQAQGGEYCSESAAGG
jgi:hypothetical protein